MKEFWKLIKTYVTPYRRYVAGSVVMNILSAVFNVFSFSLLIPILQILFKVGERSYEFIPWEDASGFNDIINNVYYFVSLWIQDYGESRVLLMLCLIFCAIVLVKTSCYFGAAAVMVPIRARATSSQG